MTKEKWIEEVMLSIETLKEADPSDNLLQTIQGKMGKPQVLSFSKSTIVRWSIAASVLIILNLSVISYYRHHNNLHHTDYSAATLSNQFNTGTSYNY